MGTVVLDDEADPNHNTLACFCLSSQSIYEYSSIPSGGVAVGVIGAQEEKKCLAGSPNWNVDRIAKPAMIGSVLFNVYLTSSAGMSQGIDATIYRAFHAGKCYQLSIAMAQANAKVFDPPVRELSKQDTEEVMRSLEQARDSFRFLK